MNGKRQTRHLELFFIFLPLAAGIGQPPAQKQFEISFHAGYAFTAMGDLNESIELMRDAGLDQNKIGGGFCLSGRFLYSLTDQYALAFGTSMVNAGTQETLPIVWTLESGPEPVGTFDLKHMIDCRFISFQAGIAFRKPFDSWSLRLIGTLNCYFTSLTESGEFETPSHKSEELKLDYKQKSNSNGLGFEMVLNPVYPLSARLSISGEAGYRSAKIKMKSSDFTPDNFYLDFSGPFIGAGLNWNIR